MCSFTQVMCRDGDSSLWTRTRVPIWLDSDSSPTHSDSDSNRDMRTRTRIRTSGLGPDSANCVAEDSIQVHMTSHVKTLESETATGLLLTRHGYVTYRCVTSWQNIKTFHHCGRCLVLELGNSNSLGLVFGLDSKTPGLGLGLVTCWTRTRVLSSKTRTQTRLETCRTRTRLGLEKTRTRCNSSYVGVF